MKFHNNSVLVHAETRGLFGETRTAILDEFCFQSGEHLDVLDANGDKFLDMTCHSSTGNIQIAEGHIYYHGGKFQNLQRDFSTIICMEWNLILFIIWFELIAGCSRFITEGESKNN